jgi:hypothetical protein
MPVKRENLSFVEQAEKPVADNGARYSNPKSFVNLLLPPQGIGEGWGGVKNLRIIENCYISCNGFKGLRLKSEIRS